MRSIGDRILKLLYCGLFDHLVNSRCAGMVLSGVLLDTVEG